MIKILFISGNANKTKEIQQIIGNKFSVTNIKLDLPELQFLDVNDVIKEKINYVYNNLNNLEFKNKCKDVFHKIGIEINDNLSDVNFICEDTGFYIKNKQMNGFPGALIKFYYESLGNEEIIRRDKGSKALVKCSIGLIHNNKIYEKSICGKVKGRIAKKYIKNNNAFGWDPIFIPKLKNTELNHQQGKSYAELNENDKNKISHRTKALKKLEKILIIHN